MQCNAKLFIVDITIDHAAVPVHPKLPKSEVAFDQFHVRVRIIQVLSFGHRFQFFVALHRDPPP